MTGEISNLFLTTIPVLIVLTLNSIIYTLTWFKIRSETKRLAGNISLVAYFCPLHTKYMMLTRNINMWTCELFVSTCKINMFTCDLFNNYVKMQYNLSHMSTWLSCILTKFYLAYDCAHEKRTLMAIFWHFHFLKNFIKQSEKKSHLKFN